MDYRLRSLIPFFLVYFFESIGREGGRGGGGFSTLSMHYYHHQSINQSSYTSNNTSHQLPHSFIHSSIHSPTLRTSTILPSHSPPSTTTIARRPNKKDKQAASYNLVPSSTRYPPSRSTYPRRFQYSNEAAPNKTSFP